MGKRKMGTEFLQKKKTLTGLLVLIQEYERVVSKG